MSIASILSFHRYRTIVIRTIIHPTRYQRNFISTDHIRRVLDCWENNKPTTDYDLLARAPYLCQIHGLEERFVRIVDRWWRLFWPFVESAKYPASLKPTGIVFHLGHYNQKYDGVVVRKLGQESIAALLAVAEKVDLSTLQNRHDLLSYLSGICGLIRDPCGGGIVYDHLKPVSSNFMSNLEQYLRVKAATRKDTRVNNGRNREDDDDWVFMIRQESMSILQKLPALGLYLPVIRQNGDDLLMLLCKLSKAGLDYYNRKNVASDEDKFDFKLYLASYAETWLYWRFDPDQFAPGSWKIWYELHRLTRLQQTNRTDVSSSTATIHLNYLKSFLSVACRFGKAHYFAHVLENWQRDVAYCVRRFDHADNVLIKKR